MAGQIVFAGININNIINEIKISRPQEHNTSAYIGGSGSRTTYKSSEGRVITFSSLCTRNEKSEHNLKHRINDYRYLSYKYNRTPKVLHSKSKSRINGNYILTGFDYTEDTKGNFTIDWEFREVVKFNVTRKTFRVWGKSVSSANKNKKTTTRTSGASNINTNVKYLLKTCPTMNENHKGAKCVISLQKFLQSQGFYKGYKIDGKYEIYTKKAVQGLQKKHKLKITGNWDKQTRNYFQKKYKYPTVNNSNKK